MIDKKINTVLLIDDSDADNFLHSRIIRKSGIAERIVIKNNGIQALDYLTTAIEGTYPRPELVFLDINMPGMNGWEFLEEYKSLPKDQKARVIVCMLTTAYSEKDKEKAKAYDIIDGYLGKPLNQEKLMRIYKKVTQTELN